MRWVEPIRDADTVSTIAADLKKTSNRNYIMFCLGIYSGLRISDILKLKVKDVRNHEEINLVEQKTGKRRIYPLPKPLKKALNDYCCGKDKNDWLIVSQHRKKPITRIQAWRIISEAAANRGLSSIGTHSMRKTFGYHFYQQTHDVAMLMQIFGHSSEVTTLRYIGVTKQAIVSAVKDFRPFAI